MIINLGTIAGIALAVLGLVAGRYGSQSNKIKALVLISCIGGGLFASTVASTYRHLSTFHAQQMAVIYGLCAVVCMLVRARYHRKWQRDSSATLTAAVSAGFASIAFRYTSSIFIRTDFQGGHLKWLAPYVHTFSAFSVACLFGFTFAYIAQLVMESRQRVRSDAEARQHKHDASAAQASCEDGHDHSGGSI